jgi:hypothetical protein
MRHIILSSVACLAVPYFFTLSHKRHDFRNKKKVIDHKMCVFIFSTTFVWNISHPKNNSARYYHKCTQISMQSTRYPCQILNALKCWQFSKNTQLSNFMKIRPVEVEFFHVGGHTHTHTHDEANSRVSQFSERASKRRRHSRIWNRRTNQYPATTCDIRPCQASLLAKHVALVPSTVKTHFISTVTGHSSWRQYQTNMWGGP